MSVLAAPPSEGAAMKPARPRRRRILRWLVILVVVALLAVYLVLPVVMGVVVVFPYQESVGEPPAGFEALTIQTADGVELGAWYAPPTNGAVIVLLHGAGDSREGVRDHAALLTEHGYGVLALDLRGHGESGGTTNRFGWQGTRDVAAAVEHLASRDGVTAIGGLGLSLGAEVLLGAASEVRALRAVVADGATHRSLDELRALPSERPLMRNFVPRVMFATVGLLTGDDPPTPLLDSMRDAPDARFLLIAAENDENEVRYNRRFAEVVGERAALWVAPDTSHTRALHQHPDEYEQRVIDFFDAALLGDTTDNAG
jgi:pimeloyl-ACP methyl ester carboxylesterase